MCIRDRPKGVLIYDSQTDTVTKRDIQPLHPLQVCKGSYADLKERMLKHTAVSYTHLDVYKRQV